mgnify:CR=1 FL=1
MSMNENHPKSETYTSACDELRSLLPAYVIGAADADEIARVRVLLEQCPEASADMEEYAAVSAGLYTQIAPVIPPADLHDRILGKVSVQADLPPPTFVPVAVPRSVKRDSRRAVAWALSAAAALLLIASNVYWLRRVDGLETEMNTLLRQRDQVVALASTTDLQRLTLTSTAPNSTQPLATLLWTEQAQAAVLTGVALPVLAEDQTYQLWLIGDGSPISAGVFSPDANGLTAFNFAADQPIQTYQAAAISVEPAGGSSAPTTDPIALGSIPTV